MSQPTKTDKIVIEDSSLIYRRQLEKTSLLYSAIPSAVLINLLLASVTAYYFFQKSADTLYVTWLLCFLALLMIRTSSYFWFTRLPSVENPIKWARIYACSTTVTGVMWGSSIFVFGIGADVTEIMMVTIVVVSTVSGGASINAPYLPSALFFMGFGILPVGAFYLIYGQSIPETVIGILAIVYYSILVGFARNFHRVLHASITKQLENEYMAKDLAKAVEVSEAAQRSQSEFIANISHEIRTPMTGMIGTIDLAAKSNAEQERQDYLKIAQKSGKALMVLINDILDIAKLGSGHFAINSSHVNLENAIKDVCSNMQSVAQSKGLYFGVTFDLAEQKVIEIDEARIKQVLSNLIGNALKFTEEGSVNIHVASSKSVIEGILDVKVQITDTGFGIPEGKIKDLFKRFVQLDGSRSREYGGTGLGLAISKQIIELIGGNIHVSSTLDQGSCFTVSFAVPYVEEHQQKPKFIPKEKENISLSGKVLIVDDNSINRMIMAKIMQEHGVACVAVDRAKSAIDELKDITDFDAADAIKLVLMDIQMPEMDGVTATNIIRGMSTQAANLPIIAVTANSHGGEREIYLEQGFSGYVSKPIDDALLIEEVRATLTV